MLGRLPRSLRAYLAFSLIYLSYVICYYNRKNYAIWLNDLVNTVGMSMEKASVFGSAMELSYGLGKLLAGPLVDVFSSPSLILYGTLGVSSICNLALFSTGIYAVDLSLWAVNGFIQSAAWPALAEIFINWFQDSPNRGTMYSLLSTSQNIGTGSIPYVLTPVVAAYGWRASTLFPGGLGLAFAAVLMMLLEDGPQAQEQQKGSSASAKKSQRKSLRAGAVELFTSANFLILGFGYTFLTIVRVGVADWSLLMLENVRGLSTEDSRSCLASLELGGFIGGLLVGSVSDFLFAGKRTPAMYTSCLLMLPCLAVIFWVPLPKENTVLILNVAYAMLGFAGFGPHMLVGLLARELYPDLPSTAGKYALRISIEK